jgi:hypothetical protein
VKSVDPLTLPSDGIRLAANVILSGIVMGVVALAGAPTWGWTGFGALAYLVCSVSDRVRATVIQAAARR